MLDRLWAGWRSEYVAAHAETGHAPMPDGDGSLFERILNSDYSDRETHIVHRGAECFVILNRFPYGTGHLMVLPNRAVPDLGSLTAAESNELWAFTQQAVATITQVYRPDGINVGMNLGRAAGAGAPDHLHVHCLPRWEGDTNFTTTIAEARVLPEPLDVTWSKLSGAWPT